MSKISTAIDIAQKHGYASFVRGCVKYAVYLPLARKERVDSWHAWPMEWKTYIFSTVKYLNSLQQTDASVCEIGCGVGNIIVDKRLDGKGYCHDLSVALPEYRVSQVIYKDEGKEIYHFVRR